ncbi:hypothetical protein [Streptomonospora salina]|uniref:Uncharacterized protein n=1 Tax=Streptomonospora salina TaxID=104205 RepID=A0A841E9S4_9ACTN|nr:hypothetical protein [Streptomonospora salina]MBB5998059.1 hypothetical protein [Streptomonospora salina]
MSSSSDQALYDQAAEFADNLTRTFKGIRPDALSFVAVLHHSGPQVLVAPRDSDGLMQPIEFTISGTVRLRLDARIWLCWDREGQFLAVEDSKITCSVKERHPVPLFRYEYMRSWTSPPAAHLHVHAHRDEFAHLLRLGGMGRGGAKAKQDKIARLQEIHFPVGGHRYRPCVEEVLWMLIEEFGVDCAAGWEKALTEGLERWRGIQLRSAIRDNPRIASAALEALDYTVTPPDSGHVRTGSKFLGR